MESNRSQDVVVEKCIRDFRFSFDYFDGYSFPIFLLYADPMSKMPHKLSIVLQVLI